MTIKKCNKCDIKLTEDEIKHKCPTNKNRCFFCDEWCDCKHCKKDTEVWYDERYGDKTKK